MVIVCLLQRGGVCDVGVGRLCVVSDSAGVFKLLVKQDVLF